MIEFKIAENLSLPHDAVTKRYAVLGTTGSGKSYGAMKFAEELLLKGVQTIILDPVGIHWGLRLSSDKKSAGIPITVFGGLYGDVPITANSGNLIADVIIDKKISAVIDVSQFEYDTDKAKFAAAFAQRFFFRKKASPSPVMIFLEEAQEFIPQNPERTENNMLHHFVRICKIGRNFGIGVCMISQRPQELNKKALNLSQCVLAFQTSGHHERKAINEWIKDKGLNTTIADDLPSLPVGEPHLWSPGWLGISQKIKISRRKTFHPSEEETINYEPEKLNKLSPVDIAKLTESIKETVEKAKENDPEELKRKIAQLEREKKQPALSKTDTVLVSKLREEITELKKRNGYLVGVNKEINSLIGRLSSFFSSLTNGTKIMMDGIEIAKSQLKEQPFSKTVAEGKFVQERPQPKTIAPTLKPKSSNVLTEGGLQLGKCALEIVKFLAVRPDKYFSKAQIGGMTGYSYNGGSFNNALSEINTKGLIEKSTNGFIKLSENATEYLSIHNIVPGEGEFSPRIWLEKLPLASKKIYEVLLDNPNQEFTKAEIGELTGYESSGGSFNNAISQLNVLGLLEKTNSGTIRLNHELAEDGY